MATRDSAPNRRSKLITQGVARSPNRAMREMQSPQGGYYSSLDADSEHEEGKFYVWTREEIASLLTSAEYAVAAAHYGLDQPPNFENRHWHLQVVKPASDEPLLATAKRKLLEARGKRVRPGRDEKILVSWNALAIRGMNSRTDIIFVGTIRRFDRSRQLGLSLASVGFSPPCARP